MEVYLGILQKFGPMYMTATWITDRKPRFNWTMEVEGYWNKGHIPVWVTVVPSDYRKWWSDTLKNARKACWNWDTLWYEYKDLLTGNDRGLILSKFDDLIRDKYVHEVDEWADDFKFNYLLAFDKIKECWDEGPYSSLSYYEVLTSIQY